MLVDIPLSLQGLNLICLGQGLSCQDELVTLLCREFACCAGRMSLA